MSTMKNLLGMLGSGTPASNPFVGANLLTQAQANQARTPAMMQAGLNLLANSGYTTTPTTLGQAIGKAGQAGMQAYNQDLTRRLQLQDMATKRAAAKTAAARSAWEHDQKVKMLQGNQALAAKYGLSGAVDPKLLAAHIKTQTPQSAIAKLQADLFAGRITPAQYDIGIQNLTRPATTISMQTDPNLTRKGIGGKHLEQAADGAAAAGRKLANLASMSTFMATGVPTGRVASASLPIREVLSAFGFHDKDIPLQQAMNSIGNSLALDQHGEGKGPMTDKDFGVYRTIVPGMANTREGNALIMRRMQRELIGDQVYYQVVNEMSRQGLDKIDTVAAWKETARRLDADPRVGPLIPNYATVAEAEADPFAVGKVVTIGKITRGQKPMTAFIEP